MSDRREPPTAATPSRPDEAAATEPAAPRPDEPPVWDPRPETAAPFPSDAPITTAAPEEPLPFHDRPPAVGQQGPPPAQPRTSYGAVALVLALALLLLASLVGTAPFWVSVLPWHEKQAGTDPALAGRIARLEEAQQQIRQQQSATAAASGALAQLEQRIAALETRPPAAPPELAEIRQQLGSLNDLQQQLATVSAAVTDQASRLDRVSETVQGQTADMANRIATLDGALRSQRQEAAELASRLQAVEAAATSRAGDLANLGLALSLLQIRNAVEAGRPFSQEYNAFAALANARPEITAAAAPLAAAAQTGVPDRTALARGLRELDRRIADSAAGAEAAGTEAATAERGWAGAALDQLRGLVTIRPVEKAAPSSEAETAMTAAERAIAAGDLPGAIAAIEGLPGTAAAAAEPWLRTARQRLAVEAALQQVETLLTANLRESAAAPGSRG